MRRKFVQAVAAAGVAATRKASAQQAASPAQRREELYSLLGDLPPRSRRISARVVSTEERPGFVLEKLVLDLNGFEPAPAYFVRPKKLAVKAPAILYHHYHGGKYQLGKDELLTAKPEAGLPSYAEALTAQGYCALCADTWAFGERSTRPEMDIFKEMLWKGQVMWGMMVYDSLRAMDYLATRTEVDPKRIGALGMSMGSTMAWWQAALDERVKVCVDICCLTDFHALIDSGGLDGHGIYYYVPSLLKHFTTGQINALISPRPHLSLAGNYDGLTPRAGLDRLERELSQVYQEDGAPDAWQMRRYETGHFETAAMRAEVTAFLQRWL